MDKKPLVLLVDDEPEILDIYGTALTRGGFEVITAASGAACIKIATAKKPDLILLDIKMPIMDGVETFVKMKKDPATKDAKVVFLSAFGDPVSIGIDEKLAKETGALGFIKKGLALTDLVEQVKEYL